MPTQSNPDSPFVGAQLDAALGGRVPGTPTTAGKPVVQAADYQFPAPPALNTNAPGRPPKPAIPAPLAPPAATPKAATPLAAGPSSPPPQQDVGLETADAGPAAPPVPAIDTQRYREAVVQLRTRLGPVPRVFRHPSLPELPVEPDKPNWNPFTGMWGS